MNRSIPAAKTQPRTERVRQLTKVAILLVVTVSALAAIVVGTVWGVENSIKPAQPVSPAACQHPALPSGDEMQLADGSRLVCTDGTWLRP